MRHAYHVFLVAIMVLVMSCQGLRVGYDFDRDAAFSTYATFGIQTDLNTGLSELDSKRLFRITDSLLQTKGLTKDRDPDLLLEIISHSSADRNQSSVGLGIGGTGGNIGGGIQVGIPVSGSGYNREIIFNIIDRRRDQLIFQAISESNFSENRSPREREKMLTKIAAKVFQGYPPE